MRTELFITADGSPTLFVPELNEHYHSVHGAVQESKHVFIQAGYHALPEAMQHRSILEIGLGTGFNALLTLDTVMDTSVQLTYHALEPFPISPNMVDAFAKEHTAQLGKAASYFSTLHACPWEEEVALHPQFTIVKMNCTLDAFYPTEQYHLIYFDAFAPTVQPEMWEEKHFHTLYASLFTGGILVTYCAKGAVRRAMQSAGFMVERLPGPPGKREMLRATKI
jgi:tRNA U34 5-methylaminomethyl-2-thiouridine-forming methyltransferase MnmC